MNNLLIIGAGYVGMALAQSCSANGYNVFTVSRSTSGSNKPTTETITKIQTDICSDNVKTIFSNKIPMDVPLKVVYSVSADSHSEGAYRKAYVTGLKNSLAALEQHQVSRFVFVSSTGVYGENNGQWVDENSVTEPESFSGKVLLEAEELLSASKVSGTIIRFGGIYGPNRTRLMQMLRTGTFPSNSPFQYTNRIHLDDCVGVICHLLELENTYTIFNGVDSEPAQYIQMLQFLSPEHYKNAMPNVNQAPSGKRVSNQRLLMSGYEFHYPSFRQGYKILEA